MMNQNIQMTEELQVVLDRMVSENLVSGMNMLVFKDGEEVAYVQSGLADIKTQRVFSRDTIMRVYSMTKPITSAAVMLLIERGLISFGDPVYKFLPGFEDQIVWENDKKNRPANRACSIRDLMYMTSGLPYGEPSGEGAFRKAQDVFDKIDKKLYTKKQMTTNEIANALGKAGIAFDPGESWLYGTSADILGAIVEVVSGMKYSEFLQKELFEPLEMNDTGFFVESSKHNRIASAYERQNGELKLFETNHLGIRYSLDEAPAFESGGAGLTSTIDDYSHFAQMLMNGGVYKGRRILDEQTVEFMAKANLTPWQHERFNRDWKEHAGYSYGCLMQHMVSPEQAYFLTWKGEYGWDGWLGTYFCNSPDNKVTILMGMQICDPDGNHIHEKIRNVVGQYL